MFIADIYIVNKYNIKTMGKYLKKFSTDSDRIEYEGSENYLEPYVSYVDGDNSVHYNKPNETRLIATYNVEDASNPTLLYAYYAEEGEEEYWTKGVDMFSKVEIDGTEVAVADLDTAQGQYQLSAGEHTVKYTLIDPTFIGTEMNESHAITRLGAVLSQCSNIISVEIPNSVTSIGQYAFYECGGLTSVTIPDSVTSIGESAFENCSGLTSVTIPNSVTSISIRAFGGCSGLTSVTIPNSVTTIGGAAFIGCSGLTSFIIPNSVTSIGFEAFWNCTALTSVTIGNSVTSIGDGAFCNCSGLTSVTIPNSVISIGNEAFYNCKNLNSIVCDAITAPNISSETFYGVKTGGALTVPIGSTGYDVWMRTSNYYLGLYSWTKVEQ